MTGAGAGDEVGDSYDGDLQIADCNGGDLRRCSTAMVSQQMLISDRTVTD